MSSASSARVLDDTLAMLEEALQETRTAKDVARRNTVPTDKNPLFSESFSRSENSSSSSIEFCAPTPNSSTRSDFQAEVELYLSDPAATKLGSSNSTPIQATPIEIATSQPRTVPVSSSPLSSSPIKQAVGGNSAPPITEKCPDEYEITERLGKG